MTALAWAHVEDDELLAALPADHPLSRAAAVAPEQMEGEEVILLEDGHCLRDHVLSACGLGGAGRHARDEGFAATSLATLAQMVGSGLGVSFLPAMAVEAGLAKAARVTVRSLSVDHASREIVVAWRAGSTRAEEGRLLAAVFAKA
jgi:LysR family hydrogen peroxide-inducible transcriptional activator